MNVIWKYLIPAGANIFNLEVPELPAYLKCIIQDNNPVMYFLCNPDRPKKILTFRIVPTGIKTDVIKEHYVDTFQIPSLLGELVFHIFSAKSE